MIRLRPGFLANRRLRPHLTSHRDRIRASDRHRLACRFHSFHRGPRSAHPFDAILREAAL